MKSLFISMAILHTAKAINIPNLLSDASPTASVTPVPRTSQNLQLTSTLRVPVHR